MSPCFVDFEAFQHGAESFKIKELCILDVKRLQQPLHMIFYPHVSWQRLNLRRRRTYAYQTNRLHHLLWDEGCSRYCRSCILFLIQHLFPDWSNEIFYVMGSQKLQFLQREFPQLQWMEYNATLSELPQLCPHSSCTYRNHGERCALLKCYRLYYHYMLLV